MATLFNNVANTLTTNFVPVQATFDTSGNFITFIGPGGVAFTTGGGSLAINTTAITGGTSGRVLFDNAGTVGEKAVTGTGDVVLNSNPTFDTDITVNGAKVGVGTSGLYNTLLGVNALTNATSFGNTAIGEDAGSAIVSGNFNTAVGWGALAGDSSESVAIGSRAQNSAAATQSVIIGESASASGIASQSVYLGYKAGNQLSYGQNNVFLGYQAGSTATTLTNCIAIGANAVLADFTDNVTVIGNTDITNTYIRTTSADIAVGGANKTKVINIGTGGSGSGSVATTLGATGVPSTTTVNGLLKQQTYTVSSLPTGTVGSRAFITDCTVGTALFGSIPTGGSNVKVPVYHDGTNWRVG